MTALYKYFPFKEKKRRKIKNSFKAKLSSTCQLNFLAFLTQTRPSEKRRQVSCHGEFPVHVSTCAISKKHQNKDRDWLQPRVSPAQVGGAEGVSLQSSSGGVVEVVGGGWMGGVRAFNARFIYYLPRARPNRPEEAESSCSQLT